MTAAAWWVIIYFTCSNKNLCYPPSVVVNIKSYATYSECIADAQLWVLPNANPTNAIKRTDCVYQ